jgi:hypothetical protein
MLLVLLVLTDCSVSLHAMYREMHNVHYSCCLLLELTMNAHYTCTSYTIVMNLQLTAPCGSMEAVYAVVYTIIAPFFIIAALFLGLYPGLLLSSYACDHIGRWKGIALTPAVFMVQVSCY